MVLAKCVAHVAHVHYRPCGIRSMESDCVSDYNILNYIQYIRALKRKEKKIFFHGFVICFIDSFICSLIYKLFPQHFYHLKKKKEMKKKSLKMYIWGAFAT